MYLIDGYNLMYQIDFEREELIDKIKLFTENNKKKTLLIFDGYNSHVEVVNHPYLQIKYVGNADDEIIYLMEKNQNPSALILVSSDNELIHKAKEKRIKIIKSQDFNFLKNEVDKFEDKKDVQLSENDAQEWLDFFKKNKK